MDELTLLRSTRDRRREPSTESLTAGRAALLTRIAADEGAPPVATARPRHPWRTGLTWSTAGTAAAIVAVLVVGQVSMTASSAHASDLLRSAASEATHYADLTPGSGEYLRSVTHARWLSCRPAADGGPDICELNDQTLDVYMPADPTSEWVLVRDWGNQTGVTGESIETITAHDGTFYGQDRWIPVDYADIPTDGAEAYAWIDAQYLGGSASRDEDNFVRIADILRSGLVPAAQRAALLDALSRIPGVSATEGVANLDGAVGVAIGRNEPFRGGYRREIIIDPDTGLVIGERALAGANFFGWELGEQTSLTAVETTIVEVAP